MSEFDELVKEHNLEDLEIRLKSIIVTAHYLLTGVEIKEFARVINDATRVVSYRLSSLDKIEKKWEISSEQYGEYTLKELNERISETIAKELTTGMVMESNSVKYNEFEKINYSIVLDNILKQNVFSNLHDDFDNINRGIMFFYHNSGNLLNDYKIFHLINNGNYRVNSENKYESLWLSWASQLFLYGKRIKHDVEVSEMLFEADYYMRKKDYKKMNESLSAIKQLSPTFNVADFFKIKDRYPM